MDNKRWGWECVLRLQEVEDRKTPAVTTWTAEFLLRAGESREFLGSWINSGGQKETSEERARCLYWINSKESPHARVTAGGLAMLLLPSSFACDERHRNYMLISMLKVAAYD
jgi:hypothetical protein